MNRSGSLPSGGLCESAEINRNAHIALLVYQKLNHLLVYEKEPKCFVMLACHLLPFWHRWHLCVKLVLLATFGKTMKRVQGSSSKM